MGTKKKKRPRVGLGAGQRNLVLDADVPWYTEYSHAVANFWRSEFHKDGGVAWYGIAEKWWCDNCPPTVNGVLGGYGDLDACDVKESSEFLRKARLVLEKAGHAVKCELALDGGAGIGRVTKNLLSRFFDKVDLLEGNQRLLDTAPEFVGERRSHLADMICSTMQDFVPSVGKLYDCIWVQWCVIYLTDAHFARFLHRCGCALRPGGFIVIKENVLDQEENGTNILKDEEDSSVTRSMPLMLHIFQQAGMEVFLQERQQEFPDGMFRVMMFAMRPLAPSVLSAEGSDASPDYIQEVCYEDCRSCVLPRDGVVYERSKPL